jgi:hypothetical protein
LNAPSTDCPAPEAEPTPAPTAGDHGLLAYPADAPSSLQEGFVEIAPLSPDDVSATFDNLDDLAWLVPIAQAKKVVLFGESHWFRVTHQIAHRVLFALQQGDHFHLLTLELPYSITPYVDHYVQLADDEAAAAFARETFAGRVDTAEMRALVEHIRVWNKQHPKRAIHLAAHDIEHDFPGVIRGVLEPYFRGIDPDFTFEPDDFRRDPSVVFSELDRLVVRARRARHVGAYSFITVDFIAGVVENLRSVYYAWKFDHGYYRQKAIIRNLTDERYLGRWLRRGKVMIWAGAHHTPSRMRLPDGGAFLREGVYLEQVFAPTRGRTYSINAIGLAYTLDAMAEVEVTTLGHVGDGYRSALTQLQAAYRDGSIGRDDPYFTWTPPSFASLAVALARTVDHRPYRITNLSWESIEPVLGQLPADDQRAARALRSEVENHDAIIIVPRSPLIRHVPR